MNIWELWGGMKGKPAKPNYWCLLVTGVQCRYLLWKGCSYSIKRIGKGFERVSQKGADQESLGALTSVTEGS